MKKIILSTVLVVFIIGGSLMAADSRFKQLELFNKVLYLVESSYYREVDPGKLIQGAIKGMMETLDPHSAYLGQKSFKKMKNETDGEFLGLGIEVTSKDGIIYVISPIDDTPAFKAGIQAGDKILEVDHESTLGMSLDEVLEKMKGQLNSEITIGVRGIDDENIRQVKLRRQKIKIRPVNFELIKDSYAYIRLKQFSRTASSSIVNALKKMKSNANGKLKGIVLDLRSNPGGLLDEAVNVSSIFLKDGIVVSTEARDPKNKEIRYVNKSIYKELKTPIVVLINAASASASEIVAGALQDQNRALIMGDRSFGKGSVQHVVKIDELNGVKLTIAQYMTPKGTKIQAIGIVPDVKIDELGKVWTQEKENAPNYLREVDLRNHLTATIETEEEKKIRVAREKEDRLARRRARSERKNMKKSDIPIRPKASEDYQVVMAISYLDAMKSIKKLTK